MNWIFWYWLRDGRNGFKPLFSPDADRRESRGEWTPIPNHAISLGHILGLGSNTRSAAEAFLMVSGNFASFTALSIE
ncbi:hypothetical protein ASPCADRAFT_207900 [Aspergillus carbonarius ITEM 5010]|uniref:Uncharacterized protein n=1 Tax=Aspergillus carbonarius (strain ITEM 5010) TaxID=602072 RepID=A0A1R3RLR3_ASPC5|nr:hypothetical protein ASPCADRAFT_207900 [Aspergillus carbonarius ITEM 5010]